ncbi:MAG: cupin domain-containing protein [Gammaproteobacteria bacterium]|nr:cupin domain-containing protein [Gammaproteobacteria bacterium]
MDGRFALSLIAIVVLVSCATAGGGLPDPLQAGWQGASVCERLHEDPQQRVLRCTFPPGSGHERHFHAAHFGYTIRGGTMRITDPGGTREVNVPDGYHFTSDGIDWHEVLNIGDTTAVFLIVETRH